jgi:hydroxymethylpyrimidine pyrophosphatase-like HAD family hydrolase
MDGSLGVDFRTEERFHQASFDSDVALETLLAFRAHGLDPCIYVEHPDFDIVVSESPSTCAAHLARIASATTTGDLVDAALTTDVYAFSVLGLSREQLGPVLDQLARTNGSHAILYREPEYGQFGLMVNPPGVTKWSGIESYLRLHDIDATEVLAVGDGLNDIPMLERAGIGVSVRGGAPETIAVAQHLIDPPMAGGWAQIIELLDRL